MKNKIIYLFTVLFLVSCGSGTTSSLAPDTPRGVSSPQVTVQSILSTVEKGRYKEGELLVKFKSGVVTASSLKTHRAIGAVSLKRYSTIPDLEKVKLPEGVSVKDAIIHYMNDPNVEFAAPNYLKRVLENIPNDPFFNPQQWALRNKGSFASGTAGADISAALAWDIDRGGGNIVIAVIDSGIDFNHPDFFGNAINNIWTNPGESNCTDGIDNDGNGFIDDCKGWNFVDDTNDPFDDNGHGTHVSGIIGAAGNNGVGISGVMWSVQLMPLKSFNSEGFGTTADVVGAINYAVMMKQKGVNIRVINASYGSATPDSTEQLAISTANGAGILFVASAGNGGGLFCEDGIGNNNDSAVKCYPASYDLPNIISVAASDQNDRLASFSNFGANSVHIAAPGVYILSTVPLTGVAGSFSSLCTGSFAVGYDFCQGTSMAAPHVTGIAGLLWNYYDYFTLSQIRGTIFRYRDVLASFDGLVKQRGRANAYMALSSLLTPTNLTAVAQSSSQVSLAWTDNATGEDGYDIERKAPGGTFAGIKTLGTNAVSYTDSGLSANTTYTYRVRAWNNIPAVSRYSDEVVVTTLSAETPPPSSSSGGGGCSIGAKQNVATATADLAVLLLPLLVIVILRRHKR